MKANELRIGNLLEHDGMVVVADGVSILDIWSATGNDYEPTPLTTDWLKRLGFDQESSGSSKDGWWQSYGIEETTDKFGLQYILDIEKFEFYYDVGSFQQELEIKHVHQLQNLYFAITGEELTLNN